MTSIINMDLLVHLFFVGRWSGNFGGNGHMVVDHPGLEL